MFGIFKRRKAVKKINEALGIELQSWQIDYIFAKRPKGLTAFRSSYKTLTIMLRQMMDKKSKYVWSMGTPLTDQQLKDFNLSGYTPIYTGITKPNFRSRNYLLRWRQAYKKLQAAGLNLAEVRWIHS